MKPLAYSNQLPPSLSLFSMASRASLSRRSHLNSAVVSDDSSELVVAP